MKIKMFINFIILVIMIVGVLLFVPEPKQITGGFVFISTLFGFWIPEIIWRKINNGNKH